MRRVCILTIFIGFYGTTRRVVSQIGKTHTLLITGAEVGVLASEFLRLSSAPLPGFYKCVADNALAYG